ncbi:MAG: hypothetical protein ACTSXZ_00235 [Alphaproteobacteria bacterium]
MIKKIVIFPGDDIGLTLEHADEICAYGERRRKETRWLFGQEKD